MAGMLEAAINAEDLRKLAKRRLPRIAFDFIEGGLDDEDGIVRNEQTLRDVRLVPRYGVDVTTRDQRTELFGRTYAGPLGIAPTGLAALFRPGADMMLARAARDADVPFILSGAGTALIEELGRIAPQHGWYQLYIAKDRAITEDMIKRTRDAGLSTLVVTVDVPVGSKRERNMRNGFTRPLKMTMKTRLDALLHPGWVADFLRAGMPLLANWAKYAPAGSSNAQVADFVAQQTLTPVLWKDIETFRRLWSGKLVIKGIMHPDDAVRCASLGVDGVMVSNHGGRQLDKSPGPIEVLPAIVAAAGDKLTVMYDSGIRRGSDVVAALCLGAKYAFVGRTTLYGTAVAGQAGAAHALAIFRDEIDRTMAQIGAPDIRSLGSQFLFWEQMDNLRRNLRT